MLSPFRLAFLAALAFPLAVQSQAAWEPDCLDGKTVVASAGGVSIVPKEGSWSCARALGSDTGLLWSQEGVSVSLNLAFELLAPAPDGKGDADVFIGFCVDKSPSNVQSADNVLGLGLRWSKSSGSVQAFLSRKEFQGSNAEARGDQWGNPPRLGPSVEFKSSDGRLSLTLKASSAGISALGLPEPLSAPAAALDPGVWSRPCRLLIQAQNRASGRASVSASKVSARMPGIDPAKFKTLDLRPFADMGFKDDVAGDFQGGWTDQGSNDLRHLKPGLLKLRSIPFDVIAPETNGGKSCLVLRSSRKEFLPEKLGPIPVGAKASSIVFLHSAAWASKPGEPAGRYLAVYEDGGSVEIPLTSGVQLDDWWSMREPQSQDAVLAFKVKSDDSASGFAGLYAFRWRNPEPQRPIRSLSLFSSGGDAVLGVLAITLVDERVGQLDESLLKCAFLREDDCDFRKNPPDKDVIPDRIVLKAPKAIDSRAFSVSCGYRVGDGYEKTLEMPAFVAAVKAMGGVIRYPYGFDSDSFFWPYEIDDWYKVLEEKGGSYGAIQKSMYKGKGKPPHMVGVKAMLEFCRRNGFRMILPINCVAMFDGKDFVYVKTLAEERMRSQNPLEGGKFSEANLAKIVERNGTLADYVVDNGYADTVAFWEMGNERWDMKGSEYASVVAAHVKMLRAKIPDAKVVVCIAGVASYSANMDGLHSVVWNRDLLSTLSLLGMARSIDYFAPHEYPFLKDSASEIVENHLGDWCVRNLYRDLDYVSAELDKFGFANSRLYATEWGVQSDALGDSSRNDLLTSMAAALATAKTMMAVYSHPRVDGGTIHTFLHASLVSKAKSRPFSKWGCQCVFFKDDGTFIDTPVSHAAKLFISFASDSVLQPCALELPKGVNCLRAKDSSGRTLYFVVNSSSASAKLPVAGRVSRTTLKAGSVFDTSIAKYGSYGEEPGDLKDISPAEFSDPSLPPYSISLLKEN